jgi:hypothetical protein
MKRTPLLLAGVLVLLGAARAQAYPQWQFSTGVSRCNVCHFAPAGGGLITGYGRDASADDLSTFTGEGAFLYGTVSVPSWLSLGGDFRGAFASEEVGDIDGGKRAVFPMQADLQARAALPFGFSVYASGGMRGQVRPNEDLVPQQNYQPISTSQLISREHWLMWQAPGRGWYVRAGRFYAPYGLRLAEHVTYIRRDLGFDLLRETYNVSGGLVVDDWEMHLTAFAPDFVRHIGSEESGGSAYFERRVGNGKGSIGAQSRFARGRSISRLMSGLVGKYYLEGVRTLLLAEADLVTLLPDRADGSEQLIGAAGASLLPIKGLIATVLVERNQEDLRVRNLAWDALTASIGWFPAPHSEIQLVGRLQLPEGGAVAKTLLLQVHYFL